VGTQGVQIVVLLVILAVFGAWCVYVLARLARSFTRRGRARPPMPAEERLALYAASAPALIAVAGFLAWCIAAQFTPPLAMITGVPFFFYILPLTFTAACIVAPWAVYGAARAWRARVLGLPARVLHASVALAAVTMIPFCAYWCLLGVRA
jgi:hypothetical protein